MEHTHKNQGFGSKRAKKGPFERRKKGLASLRGGRRKVKLSRIVGGAKVEKSRRRARKSRKRLMMRPYVKKNPAIEWISHRFSKKSFY